MLRDTSPARRAGPVLAAALLAATAAHGAEEVHHVGAVDDDLFVAVVTAQDPADPERRAVFAYLCDSQSIWSAHAGLVEGDTAAFSDTNIELLIEFSGDGVSGQVTHAHGKAQPFDTHTASGAEGLYVPEDSFDEDGRYADYVGGWVVLAPSPLRQRGAIAIDLAPGAAAARPIWPRAGSGYSPSSISTR